MKQTYEFEFNEKTLGDGWFNLYNLRLLLYSQNYTYEELLRVREYVEPRRPWIQYVLLGAVCFVLGGVASIALVMWFTSQIP